MPGRDPHRLGGGEVAGCTLDICLFVDVANKGYRFVSGTERPLAGAAGFGWSQGAGMFRLSLQGKLIGVASLASLATHILGPEPKAEQRQ